MINALINSWFWSSSRVEQTMAMLAHMNNEHRTCDLAKMAPLAKKESVLICTVSIFLEARATE